MTPLDAVRRKRSERISHDLSQETETTARKPSQCSTPASPDNVSSQQRSDKAGYTTRTAREKQFDRGEAHLLQAPQAVNEERRSSASWTCAKPSPAGA